MLLAVHHIRFHPTVIVIHLKVFDARLEATPCLFRNLSFQRVTRTRKEIRRNPVGESPWLYVSLTELLQI
jgi:hypothetical protein